MINCSAFKRRIAEFPLVVSASGDDPRQLETMLNTAPKVEVMKTDSRSVAEQACYLELCMTTCLNMFAVCGYVLGKQKSTVSTPFMPPSINGIIIGDRSR